MLRVTIEMLPFGRERGRRIIGNIEIANDGTGTPYLGNYKVRLSRRGKPQTAWREGVVTGFPRNTLGPYDLLLRALVALLSMRNREAARLHADNCRGTYIERLVAAPVGAHVVTTRGMVEFISALAAEMERSDLIIKPLSWFEGGHAAHLPPGNIVFALGD